MRRHYILIPLAALLATSPLFFTGCSCGHDFTFHLQSWLDAASQLRHGAYPHWAFSPAFHAGEPRFVFYPPLSWLLGATLSLLLPFARVPAVFTFLALTAAGFAMHRLAAAFFAENTALFAAVLYLANPYMLFNAFERTAYAELLAAAFVPLLFLAALRLRPTIAAIAVPLALLWLTNAPAAVMGSYTLALLAIFRIAIAFKQNSTQPGPLRLALTSIAGTLLGLALAAFYLFPAAYERRYVQIAMAIIPNMRVEDNFLFAHTADAPHNAVLHTASLLAVALLALTAALLLISYLRRRVAAPTLPSTETAVSRPPCFVIPAEPALRRSRTGNLLSLCAVLTLLIAFLLTPISLPLWHHLPELAFLQFPWRLLTILAPIFALAGALAYNTTRLATSRLATTVLASAALLIFTALCIHLYRQPCETADTPDSIAKAFATHHGVAPTDEYTPTNADNDVIRPDEPAWWLAATPNAFAPNTTPNPGSTDPDFSDGFPESETISSTPPPYFELRTTQPTYLILNLRDYLNWRITTTDQTTHTTAHPQPASRDDGLLAIPLTAPAVYRIDIAWHITRDESLGLALSLCALCLLAALALQRRAAARQVN